MTAVGHKRGYAVGVYAIGGKPFFVKADHIGKIASGGVSGDKYFRSIASVLYGIVKRPCHCRRCIVDTLVKACFGKQTIPCSYYYKSLISQLMRYVTAATCKTSAVKPYHNGAICGVNRIMYVEPAHSVGICSFPVLVLYILFGFVAGAEADCRKQPEKYYSRQS